MIINTFCESWIKLMLKSFLICFNLWLERCINYNELYKSLCNNVYITYLHFIISVIPNKPKKLANTVNDSRQMFAGSVQSSASIIHNVVKSEARAMFVANICAHSRRAQLCLCKCSVSTLYAAMAP